MHRDLTHKTTQLGTLGGSDLRADTDESPAQSQPNQRTRETAGRVPSRGPAPQLSLSNSSPSAQGQTVTLKRPHKQLRIRKILQPHIQQMNTYIK
jgi:hypothetical protein